MNNSDSQGTHEGGRSQVHKDGRELSSKIFTDESTAIRSNNLREESKSPRDDVTVEKGCYESKKIQEYAEQMLERQHSTNTDLVALNKMLDTKRPSKDTDKEYFGDHSTLKPEQRQPGKIVKQLYRSSFDHELHAPAHPGDSNAETNEYRTNINSLYLKEEQASSQACNTVQNEATPRKIGLGNQLIEPYDASSTANRPGRRLDNSHSPQLSYVDSTMDINASQRRQDNPQATRYHDSTIDVSLPGHEEHAGLRADEDSEDKESQSSLTIQDILKYKKVDHAGSREQEENSEKRIKRLSRDLEQIRSQHQELMSVTN